MEYVIGIDVGSGSVRGALVNKEGEIEKIKTKNTRTWHPRPDFYQQSSNEIWLACCEVIKNLMENISPESVKGLGFDATGSVVICDENGNPVAVDLDGDDNQDIIMWMDHRAKAEAAIIDKTEHPVLKYVGGAMLSEWVIPKILWLKRNHPKCWKRAAYVFLLPDFLSWKATGSDSRSLCSVACGCNYKASDPSGNDDSGWLKSYFDALDLGELAENNWKKVGSKILKPGELCGQLNRETAEKTGLLVTTKVATSITDGQCGGLGAVGCNSASLKEDLSSRLSLICGTSSCHLYHPKNGFFVPGVRGPYYEVVLPNLWLQIAGQSAAGKLIDHIINIHPATELIRKKYPNVRIIEYLNKLLHKMAKDAGLNSFDELTTEVHVYPDFYGNRTPLADPNMRGMMCGLTLNTNEDDLALWYLATIQALTYSTKHIIEEIQKHSVEGEKIESVLICGGLSKNEIFVQTHANALGLPVFLPERTESVLLGSSMLAAMASGFYPDLKAATLGMAGPAKQIEANSSTQKFHEKKYKAYFELQSCQMKIREIMNSC